MTDPVLWILVLLQLAMGAFDILYHHEFTERLAWRASASKELVLHAARNALYAVLFLTFAWTEPRGAFAILIAFILVAEILITLWDFVEEDLSRRLPASERVTHTLLALNYGAIMAYVLPILAGWADEATRFASTSYGPSGLGSILLTLAAVGVLVFALHDIVASRRAERLAPTPPARLAAGLTHRHRIVVIGGTGFVGSRLCDALAAAGHAVIVVTRDPHKAAHLTPPFATMTNVDQIPKHLRIDAIVNLAGEPVATGLWTRSKRLRIIRSRLAATRDAARLLRRLDKKPKVLIGASAIGFYGLRDDEILSETDPGRDCFSHRTTAIVERAIDKAAGDIARPVKLRIGLVLAHQGGLLGNLLPAFDWCLGGPIGSGRQWMSWIERDDLVRLILHIITDDNLRGPVNAVAPLPVRNREFAKVLGQTLGRPAWLRLPAWPLRLLLGAMGHELLLSGQRVKPEKALASGFRFEHEDVASALRYCIGGESVGDHVPVKQIVRPYGERRNIEAAC